MIIKLRINCRTLYEGIQLLIERFYPALNELF